LLNDGLLIGQKLADVAGTQRPSLDEAKKIIDELNALTALARNAGPQGEKALQDLQRAVNDIMSSTQKILQSDFGKAFNEGASLAAFIGPYVADCVACATTISTSVAGMGTGGGVAVAAGAGCEAGAPCAVAAVAAIGSAVSGAVGSVVSAPSCQNAAKDSAKLKATIDSIQSFVDNTAKVLATIPENVDKAIAASDALVRLAEQLGKNAERPIRNIEQSINKIVQNANNAGDAIERDIAPRVTKLSSTVLKEMTREVNTLSTCFNKLLALSGSVGEDTLEGIAKMAAAAPDIVDSGKVIENAAKSLDDGKNAMEDYLRREHSKLNKDLIELHKDVWGVAPGVVDLNKTGKNAVDLLTRPKKVQDIADDAKDILTKELKIIEGAIEAGKRGFLEGPRVRPAKAKYASAKAATAAAKTAFRKAAIASAKAKATSSFATLDVPSVDITPKFVKPAKLTVANIDAAMQKAKPLSR
jgi:ABC-type transporter Mla subunit MlaD